MSERVEVEVVAVGPDSFGAAEIIKAESPTTRPVALETAHRSFAVATLVLTFALCLLLAGIVSVSRAGASRFRPLTFPLTVVALAFSILTVVRFKRPLAIQPLDHLRAAHPDEPWLWRRDWASGEVHAHAKGAAIGSTVLALVWNLVTFPVLLGLPAGEVAKLHYRLFLLLLFPAVGLGFVIWAIRLFVRWRIYGESCFDMAVVPAQIGGSLEGEIHLGHPLAAMRPVKLTLSCINRQKSSGQNSSTFDRILWSDSQTVQTDGSGAIPVAFYIPGDSRATDGSDPHDQIVWRLNATSSGAIPYLAKFEVPVFKVTGTAVQVAEASAIRGRRDAELQTFQWPADSPIKIGPGADGRTEVYFPAFMNPGPALGVAGFLGLWTGSLAVMTHFGVPFIFRTFWWLFEIILFFFVLSLWFESTRVEMGQGKLSVTRKLLGLKFSSRETDADSIKEVRAVAGMTAGDTLYSQIRIRLASGGTIEFGDGIRDRREAEWLAAEMSRQLGIAKPA